MFNIKIETYFNRFIDAFFRNNTIKRVKIIKISGNFELLDVSNEQPPLSDDFFKGFSQTPSTQISPSIQYPFGL